jgi:hypothetical protein
VIRYAGIRREVSRVPREAGSTVDAHADRLMAYWMTRGVEAVGRQVASSRAAPQPAGAALPGAVRVRVAS